MNRFKILGYIPIAIIVCFAIAIIFGVNALLPRFNQFQTLNKEVKTKTAELQSKEKYYANLRQIDNQLRAKSSELSKVNSALPDEPSVPSVLAFLQKAGTQSGLVVKNLGDFSISNSESNSNLKDIEFGLEISGTYSSFKNLITVLEKSARWFEVKSVSLNYFVPGAGSAGPATKDIFSFVIRVRTHSY
jgi:Tfp pilus assembly protein PilO